MENTNTTPSIGQTVKRIQPGDYADGRVGTVIEIDSEKSRARVTWHTFGPAQGGGPMRKQLRTWVKYGALSPEGQEAA